MRADGPPTATSRGNDGAGDEGRQIYEVAVIGGGFAGIGMGARLKQAGVDSFVIFERAEDVGGTWWSNTYPGCQCDIPSHLYSFSFALNPAWSRTYPLQPEIKEYLSRCATRFRLAEHLRMRHDVQSLEWDETTSLWRINTSRGSYLARVVVAAVGGLSEPSVPRIKGADNFLGHSFHSAQWDHSVDLRGKNVAVLGTGASAIQIVPSIQPEVASLHVFQRTPPWILPHTDRSITKFERWLYRHLPITQRLLRLFAYWLREIASPGFTRHTALLAPLELHARRHLRRQVKDARLRQRLTPTYRIGCKRVLPSNKWYPALQADNVELVTDPITEITPTGIRTATGRQFDLDVIVYATGFETSDLPIARLITGCGGRRLSDVWNGSPQAYKNATVPGFPNLFFVLGLNTGYSSMVYMIEAQLNYVLSAIETMRSRRIRAIDVTNTAFHRWNHDIQRRMPQTVWNSGGCASWYIDRNGLNTTVWPDFTWQFRRRTRRFELADYETTPQAGATARSTEASILGGVG